jgi:putative membrane protein
LGWFFFIPIFFLIFFAVRWFFWGEWWWGRGSHYGWDYDPALEILRKRFARGEISKEQYEQMKRDIAGQPS